MPNAWAKYDPINVPVTARAVRETLDIVERFERARTPAAVNAALEEFAGRHGLQTIGHLRLAIRERPGIRQSPFQYRAEQFNRAYLRQKLYAIDPSVQRGMVETGPIPWGLPVHRRDQSLGEKRIQALQYEFGIAGRGVLVPIHGPTEFSALGVPVEDDERSFVARLPELASVLQFLAVYFQLAAARFYQDSPTFERRRLTERECECLL
ncbi:MAG: autoinducer binding domain-containing protein, partial [Rhodospirillales bacterium]|nr:autoinducer binding domain-containing protein [Rhodospirillales bacterium]